MREIAFLVEDAADGGFAAHAIGTNIHLVADTLPEMKDRVLAAVLRHFDDPDCARLPVRLYVCSDRLGGAGVATVGTTPAAPASAGSAAAPSR